MCLGNDLPSRAARLTFALCMALAWCGVSAWSAARAAAAGPAADRGAELDRVFNALDVADREVGRQTFDVNDVVTTVGRDPAKLLDWVRDQTFWVPYAGALRGPAGVLMDRVGSSLDRALLLAELLRAGGGRVRLVHATLTVEQAKAILARVRPLPANWLAAVDPADGGRTAPEQIVQFAARFGLDAAALKASCERTAVRADRLAEDAVRRITKQAPAVLEAVARATVPKRADRHPSAAGSDAVAAARDHWWVTMEQNGTWTALDPMLPQAVPGSPAVDVQGESMEYEGKLPQDPAVCHEVQIQVMIERWEGGKLREEAVLKHALRPADVLGKRVALSHQPIDWPADLNLIDAQDPAGALTQAAARQHEWAPILSIGSENVIQGSFTDGGRVNAHPVLDPTAKIGAGVSGAAQGALDAFNVEPAKPIDQGQLTAEWIDYLTQSPGRPATRIRRQLFDLIGPAARAAAAGASGKDVPKPQITDAQALDRSLSTLGQTEILLQPCRLSSAFVEHVAVQGALANRAFFRFVASHRSMDGKTADAQLGNYTPPPGPVYGLGYVRGRWSPVGGMVYLDHPNILSHHQMPRVDPAGKLVLTEGFDIVTNDVAVRGGAAMETAEARAIRIRQGVTDTVAEAALAGGAEGGMVENASELFATALDGGEPWVTLRQGDDGAALAALQLPGDARARIAQELADGYVVLVPKSSTAEAGGTRARLAWWRVDPATGQTLGIGQQGWGSAAAETAMMYMRIALKALLAIKCISTAMAGHDAGGVALCVTIGVLGGAGLYVGGLGGGALGYAADIFSALK